ncbi:LPP20 family lipoprotein [Rheinheimera sp. F8]|uniref:LPP20 family lipoprotein n=1 Tax=Rheinheimera sp. F8 TaxID=1763998 RepID=UPI000744AE8E|nr:LPP20 family lipoprotein [Rheinheimera sp. F8]ALZ74343.1 flagellar biosynthesis protein FlgP [Rheinheimera sp. F8]
MRIVFIFLSLGLLSGCGMFYDREVQWETVPPKTFPVLKAIGYAPLAEQKADSAEQRMLMAIKASKLEAYRELAEQVYGQKVDYKVTMQQAVIGNDKLKASVQGIIKGARVVKTYPVGEFYATEMELDFKQVYEIYQNSAPVRRIKSVKYY